SCAWVQKGVVPAVVLIAADTEEPVMILPDFWLGTAEKTTWYQDFVLHHASHSDPNDFVNLLVGVIRERGWAAGQIGYEAGHEMLVGLPIAQWEYLRNQLGDASWAAAGEAIWKMRMIKSQAEVDRLRRAAVATNRAHEALRDHVRIGTSELEAGAVLRRAMVQNEVRARDGFFLNIAAGRCRFSDTATQPKNHPARAGEDRCR